MLYFFTEISKYLIIAVMFLYVFECILYECVGENYVRFKGIYIRQRVYLFFLQFFAYGTLCLKTGKLDYAFLAFFTYVVMFALLVVTAMLYPRVDKVLLNNMALLLSTGFIILSRLDFSRAIKQFAIVTVSMAIGMSIPGFLKRVKGLTHFGYIYAAVGIIPLLIVLLLGAATNGSKLSYTIGGITIQPSELVKIVFIFCIAALLSRAKTFLDIVVVTMIAACHVIILVLSKDLGSGLIFFVAYLFMLLVATRNYILFALGWAVGGVGAVFAYKVFRHVQVRVQAFKDPFSVIDNQGYQITQSLFAVGSGSFFGTGLNKGTPGDIPFVWSDFIFSAVSEEMGAIYAVCMLLVCLSCFMIMLNTSMKADKKFQRLLAFGFGVMYIFQVFLTVGGGIKFIPLTGVTLPFVSYGGSSVLSSVIVFFVVQWVIITYRDKEAEELEEERKRIRAERRNGQYRNNRYADDYADYEEGEYYEDDEYYEEGDYEE